MTDMTVTPPRRQRGARRRGAEFRVYFGLIFLLVLPWAAARWLADTLRGDGRRRGPLARAWTEADTITPIIFSA